MKTAIIILNYNSEDDTLRYVNEIKDFKVIDTIIVVDNCSEKGTKKLEVLEKEVPKMTLIKSEKNGGYSFGNNLGIKSLKEKYDYLIISNPDISIKEDAINKTIDVLKNNEKIAMAAPRMLDANGVPVRRSSWKIRKPGIDMANSTRLTEVLFHWVFKKGEYSVEDFKNKMLKVEAISGAFFIIKYDILEKCDFFDKNVFLFYEEDILATKIKNLGYEVYSLNDINFTHFESKTIDKFFSYFNKIKQLQRSKMYYQKKYNKINVFQVCIFEILNLFRKIELLIEIPIRKMMKNIK